MSSLMPRKTGLLATALLLCATQGHAVPSYSRQTGDSCGACHVGGFGPQLTPHGIAFKLGGYTDSNGQKGLVPLSAMFNATFTHTAADQAGLPDRYKANNNATFQELSLFMAGRLSDQVGVFSQLTHSVIEKSTSLDRLDLRYAHETPVKGQAKPAVVGLSLSNLPTSQDPFNSLAAFGYPYLSSGLAPSPAASTLLDSGLDGSLIGLTAYTLLPNGLYLEGGAYRDQGTQVLDKVENIQPENRTRGLSPYARVAYYQQRHKDNYSVGLVAMQSDVHPIDAPTAAYNRLRDVGVDASYQHLGNRQHIWGSSLRHVHEQQDRRQQVDAGEASQRHGSLDSTQASAYYTFNNSYGLVLGLFEVRGSADALAYAGNRTARPDSNGYTLEANWTPWGKDDSWKAPWANVRLGLQYTGYLKFNGARNDFDGTGLNARDQNTLMAYLWSAW